MSDREKTYTGTNYFIQAQRSEGVLKNLLAPLERLYGYALPDHEEYVIHVIDLKKDGGVALLWDLEDD